MALAASRNEAVGLQAVVFNDSDTEMSGIDVTVENIPGVTAKIYASGAVKVDRNMLPIDRYFDLLRPSGWETIAPKSFQPYWIDFTVSKDAEPGTKNGKIVFKHGNVTKSVSVQLRISQSVLPVTPTLPLAFAFGKSWVEQFYGRALTEEELFQCYDAMLEHRLGPLPMWDGSGFFFQEKTVRYCADRGMNVFFVSVSGMSDAAIDASLRNTAPKLELLRDLKLLGQTYQFAFDEILFNAAGAERKLPWMRATYERFHEKYPDVKRLATSWPDKRLDDFTDIYVVPVGRYRPEMSEKKAVWWYSVGSASANSSPDFRIDFPPILQRYFFLANWRAGIDGHLYWATHREWPLNKELRTKKQVEEEWAPSYASAINGNRVDDCGAGNLFYPGGPENIVVPSVRAKYLRDGVNDYEYLAQMRAATKRLKERRPDGWEKLADDANALMNFAPDLKGPPQAEYLSWRTQFARTGELLGITSTGQFAGWLVSRDTNNPGIVSLTRHPAAIRQGEAALRVLPTEGETFVFQDIPVQPDKAHSASVYIKTDDLRGKAWLRIEYLDTNQAKLQSADSSETVSGSTGGKTFRKVEASFGVAPKEAVTLRILLVSRLDSGKGPNDAEPLAKAFYDDVEAAAGDRKLDIANSGFEEKQHHWHVSKETQRYFDFRNRLIDCLERICVALNETGPFANAHAGRERP